MAITHSTVNGDASMNAPLIILFGPQSTHFTEGRLLELRKSIVGNTSLTPLIDTIRELPSLWPTLQQACAHLNMVPGAEQLNQLCQFFEVGTLPNVAGLKNILLAPLTVISQIVEFLRLEKEAERTLFPVLSQEDSGLGNVQGFCVGFLAAAAVACSRDRTEFQHNSSVALRLAVCIGSIVDGDEGTFLNPLDHSSAFSVRWKTDLEQAHFESTLSSYPTVSCHEFSHTSVSFGPSIYRNGIGTYRHQTSKRDLCRDSWDPDRLLLSRASKFLLYEFANQCAS